MNYKNNALVLLIAAAAFGTNLYVLAQPTSCPEQVFPSIAGFNAAYIRVDPISGDHLRLNSYNGFVNKPIVISGYVCDKEWLEGKQSLTMIRIDTGTEIAVDDQGFYSFTVTYNTAGTKSIPLRVQAGDLFREGTAFVFVHVDTPPVFIIEE